MNEYLNQLGIALMIVGMIISGMGVLIFIQEIGEEATRLESNS